MSKEQESIENLHALKSLLSKEQESVENLHVLGRRQNKADKIRIILNQALSECGEGSGFEEVRQAIGAAMSKVQHSSKKNYRKFKINQEIVEQAKNKQKKWWDDIKSGLGIKPSLEMPNVKKEKENESE